MVLASSFPVLGQFDPAVVIDPHVFGTQPPLVLPGCTWEDYLAVDAAIRDRGGVRVRFLQGYLEVYQLNPDGIDYTQVAESAVLPGIPLDDVAKCARIESASQAIREFQRRVSGTS